MAATAVTPISDKLLVGRKTAARLIEVSTRTIDDAIRAGELEAYRLGRRVLIHPEKLLQFAQRERTGGQDVEN